MKSAIGILFTIFSFAITYSTPLSANTTPKKSKESSIETKKDSLLRHVVLLKFKGDTPTKKLAEIESVFAALPSKIKEIVDFEWGLNNSPEGLDKGFTHCFFVSFKNEEGRAIYLPHPDHKAFVDLATPYIEDVLVVDYWAP